MLVKRVPYKLGLKSMGDPTRSEGLHLSDVIWDIAVKTGILDRKWVEQDMHPMTLALGLAWEEWAVQRHPGIVFHPGEIEKDGILMSPDGIEVGDPVHFYRVHEFKYTRKSSREFEAHLASQDKKVWMWLCQIKGYCMGVETAGASLHVAFANGDYSRVDGDEGKPQYDIFRLQFSSRELVENWAMLRSHAERMRKRQ